jgi:catechol 2,3-dioxygenase-like lactoylglutathione lyase family enzyme
MATGAHDLAVELIGKLTTACCTVVTVLSDSPPTQASDHDFDEQVGLVYQPAHARPIDQGNGFNRIAFFVKSAAEVDEKAKMIAAEGYQTVIPPSTSPIPGGRLCRCAHLKGPDGYTIEFAYFDPKVIVAK